MNVSMTRALQRLLVAGGSLVVAVLFGEAATRLIDGYPIWPIRLVNRLAPKHTEQVNVDALAREYAGHVVLAPGVEGSWFSRDPTPVAPHAVQPWVVERLRLPGGESRLFEFNRAFLTDRLCKDVATSMFGTMADFLYFDPVEPGIYPSYRHLRRMSAPGWFTTNSFGWRGPDFTMEKPPNTIRVAFVGASTTIGAYTSPYSYPEFIGNWLNIWGQSQPSHVKFEVLNAGRTGIDSHSIAAIVRQEVLPLQPDVVVYYEGANQFWPPGAIGYRFGRLYPRPSGGALRGTPAQHWSALGLRARWFLDTWRGGDGGEPVKPIQWIRLGSVDEQDPDPYDKNLPVELPSIVSDLDSIRAELTGIGAELAVSSFVWMVEDGMRLELPRQSVLFSYLNQDYWPSTYATMRRLADLQNRVFRNYSRRHHLPFVDLASQFPMDSNLFGDAIHLQYSGSRLQAWIVFQDLARLFEERIAAGKLPKGQASPRAFPAPAFDQVSPRSISRSAVLAGCGK
jgi:hypothetical protein